MIKVLFHPKYMYLCIDDIIDIKPHQYCSTMVPLLWVCIDGEAADHMITKKQRTYPSLFLPHTWYCMIHVIVVLCKFICISEAHNGTKYVKTVINNSERFSFISIKILPMCLISVMIIFNSLKKKRERRCFVGAYYE